MKILVLCYEYPPIGGGGGVICKNISENLARLGNKVTLLTTAYHSVAEGHADLSDPSPVNGLEIIRLNARRKHAYESGIIEMISWIRTTKKYIRDHPGFIDFDLCMAHFVLPGGEVARWLNKRYGLPYVLVSHGHEIPWVHPRQMFFFHLGAYLRIKSLCRHSSANFIQTSMMKSNIDRFLGGKQRDKNIMIPNGVDASLFNPDYTRRPDRLRILFAGRLVLQKDPMTFLKAIHIFNQSNTDFDVHILGDGKLRIQMENYVRKHHLDTKVVFLGKVPESQMLAEYQSAHLMVAPSLNEGMSIAALEALSCGVYLIATHASGFEDMIRENVNGEFIPFRNPHILAEKMIRFWQEKGKSRGFSQSFQSDFVGLFSWSRITLEYYTVLRQLSAE